MKTSSPPSENVNETPARHDGLEVTVGDCPVARHLVKSPKTYVNNNVVCIRNSLRGDFEVTFNIAL